MSSFESDTSVERSVHNGWGAGDGIPTFMAEDAPTLRMIRLWLVGGRYELREQLSAGGMGRVYHAVHRDLGRSFALKVMLEGQRAKEDIRERFFVEARLASSLCHPNIVSVTDFGLDADYGCYMVMELLEGETVGGRLAGAPFGSRLACDVIDQLTGAVRYMHARGIIHGDIKPDNVFLTRIEGEPRRRNVVKLLDFGLSFRSGSAPEHKLGGTPPYLAPERLQGAPPSPSCDVYSLGALLYEMLTGKPIYAGTVPQLMERSIMGPMPKPPSLVAPQPIDKRMDELVLRAIDRDPAKRHSSAEAFHFELRTIMNMNGLRVRKHGREVSSPNLRTRDAVNAALEAAEQGDLEAVRRILTEAQSRLDTVGTMTAMQDDQAAEARGPSQDVEEP